MTTVVSSTQRMPPPVNQRIQDGGLRPPVLKASRLSIMLRHYPRWWVQNGGRRKEKKESTLSRLEPEIS